LNDVDEEQLKLIDKYYRCNSLFRIFPSTLTLSRCFLISFLCYYSKKNGESFVQQLRISREELSRFLPLFYKHVNADFSHFQLHSAGDS
jgi:hypothetical protein